MSPRAQLGLVIVFAVLLCAVFALRIPDRFLAQDAQDSSELRGPGTKSSAYATDGFNRVMEAAGAAADRGDFETAVELFLSIPGGGDSRSVAAQLNAGQLLLVELHQPTRGFQVLNDLLLHFPGQLNARTLLADYLDAFGRQSEAKHQIREIIRVDDSRLPYLIRLAQDRTGVGNIELLLSLHSTNPDDPYVRLGVALLDIKDGRLAAAELTLRHVVEQAPELWTAQAALASALSLQDKVADYDAWRAALPAGAETSSEIWLARGQAAERRRQPEIAARCYVEAVRIDPDNLDSNQGAARLLTALERPVDATFFETRAAQLAELAELVRIDPGMTDPQHLARAAQLTESLGRLWESRGWTYHLASTDRNSPAHQRQLKHLQQMLDPIIVEKLRAEANPANHVNVSALPDA